MEGLFLNRMIRFDESFGISIMIMISHMVDL